MQHLIFVIEFIPLIAMHYGEIIIREIANYHSYRQLLDF